ncbi:hypothetical protein B7P34_19455 [Streptosporangium nondiastaticum]|uniref:Uncharacterized protein n=1 Tax=Streptosporangium nondiastaticum TaxID=35764 RepID=A0A9X7JNX5_9ACTN|nr:hypothetical protein B7P34_19455 [Streptosporangium nondiastaticum]
MGGVSNDAKIEPDDSDFQDAAERITDEALDKIDIGKYTPRIPALMTEADTACGNIVKQKAFQKHEKDAHSNKKRLSASDAFRLVEGWMKKVG